MVRMRRWRIAFVAGLGLLAGAAAGRAAGERPPTYVWLFSTMGAEVESLTDTVTEEFEEALVKAGCLPIVQRRNLPELQSHQKQEQRIAGADSLSSRERSVLSTARADAVVFGKITDDVQGGQVKIGVTLETLAGVTLASTSVRISRGKRLDAEERERRMAELASEVCSALGFTKKDAGPQSPGTQGARPPAKRTCSTAHDDFNGKGQAWWISPTGGFGIQDSAFKIMVSQTNSGDKRCVNCRVSASIFRVSATVWGGRNAATWGLYILDMSEVRGEWFSLEVEREGRVFIKRYRDNQDTSILWSGTYPPRGKDRLTIEAEEGVLIASANGAELGRAAYDPRSVPKVPLGVGFVVTTKAEAPAEVWFDDYELTFCSTDGVQ